MCTCNNNSSCSCGSLITTSKGNTGPTGPQGPQGVAGENGTDGVVSWTDYNLDCWVENEITQENATNEEITQDFIDAFCEVYQIANTPISATNDYVFTDKNVVLNINPITNDIYYPTVVVTIGTVVNGTAIVDIDDHTIIFTPDSDFVGTAVIPYTITDSDSNTSTANIYVDVKESITTESIESTVESTLIELLSSNEYWDLGLPIGTKLLISNENLGDFSTTGITAGKGLTGTKWEKWAICNGNLTNGVDDLRLRNLRGFDYADGAGNDVANFQSGSDTVTLTRDNIPPHQHKYFDAFMNAIDGTDVFSEEVDDHASSLGVTQGTIYTSSNSIQENTGDDRDAVWYDRNTSDGTDNLGNQNELKSSPDAVDITNAYVTVIVVQKIA